VKAGIIDESFRGPDYEAGSPLNRMNTGEPSYAGLSGLVKVLSALSLSLSLSVLPREEVLAVIDYPPASHARGRETWTRPNIFVCSKRIPSRKRRENGEWRVGKVSHEESSHGDSPRWRKDVVS
jgi:hypothetical protein